MSLSVGVFLHFTLLQFYPCYYDLHAILYPALAEYQLTRTCLSWIQPHPHGAILRHILNTINSFLCSCTNYFENQLLPNDSIIVRNDGDDEEDERDIKRALER
jgi:hypothetical protein